MIANHLKRIEAFERHATGDEFVEGHAERVEIGALVDGAAGAAGLLRRNVCERTFDVALRRKSRSFFGRGTRAIEIDENWPPAIDDENVRWIDVAMYDAVAVDRRNRLRQLEREVQQGIRLKALSERSGRQWRAEIVL